MPDATGPLYLKKKGQLLYAPAKRSVPLGVARPAAPLGGAILRKGLAPGALCG